MTIYRRDHSSVTGIGLGLVKSLPDRVPVKDKLTPELLQRLLKNNPRASLNEFCYELRNEHSIKTSPTALCPAFKRAKLGHNARNELRNELMRA